MNFSKYFLAFLFFLSFQTTQLSAAEKAEINPYGQMLIGDGVSVEIATFAEKNKDGLYDVLMKITGGPAFEAGIDGKVIKYTAEPAGTGYNLKFGDRNRISVRSPWGAWTQVELYLNGKTHYLAKDSVQSSNVRPLHLLTEFKESNKGKK